MTRASDLYSDLKPIDMETLTSMFDQDDSVAVRNDNNDGLCLEELHTIEDGQPTDEQLNNKKNSLIAKLERHNIQAKRVESTLIGSRRYKRKLAKQRKKFTKHV